MEVEKIIEICQAYELGYSAARMNISKDANKFDLDTDCYYAWILGHNLGIHSELVDMDEDWIN